MSQDELNEFIENETAAQDDIFDIMLDLELNGYRLEDGE